jgi:drug/metabolite transporter (DMT)-like permease
MLSLIIGTVGYALFSITVKAATRRGCNIVAVGLVNYLVAAGFYCVLVLPTPPPERSVTLLAIAGGVVFFVAYLVLTQLIRRSGLSITISVVQLAVLIPVLAGILIWGERPNLLQGVGVLCAISALPLLGKASAVRAGAATEAGTGPAAEGRNIRGMLLTGSQLCLTGAAMMILQAVNHVGAGGEDRPLFFAILFTVALVGTGGAWLILERRISGTDIIYGLFLGSWNTIHGFMLVDAMSTLPGAVVFPFVSVVSMLLSVLAAVRIWGERLERTGKIGIALALVAVLFINIGRG